MRSLSIVTGLSCGVLALAACGISLHPRVEADPYPGSARGAIPGPDRGPATFPAPPDRTEGDGVVRRVCRTGTTPGGWIAISYAFDPDCPRSPDPEDSSNAAVIQRYSNQPVGARLTVCADQKLPMGWTRDPDQGPEDGCPGASVGEGQRQTFVMRRIR